MPKHDARDNGSEVARIWLLDNGQGHSEEHSFKLCTWKFREASAHFTSQKIIIFK